MNPLKEQICLMEWLRDYMNLGRDLDGCTGPDKFDEFDHWPEDCDAEMQWFAEWKSLMDAPKTIHFEFPLLDELEVNGETFSAIRRASEDHFYTVHAGHAEELLNHRVRLARQWAEQAEEATGPCKEGGDV